MRILMLGNSFIYYHDLPKLLAAVMGEEVESITKGGSYLYERIDEQNELYAPTMKALKEEKWDYVVLQDNSKGPFLAKSAFMNAAKALCDIIKANGATPVMYATWAYREGSEKLASVDRSYPQMDKELYEAYHEAAEANGAIVADVGKAFSELRNLVNLYEPDDFHPSEVGSIIAAYTIAAASREHRG